MPLDKKALADCVMTQVQLLTELHSKETDSSKKASLQKVLGGLAALIFIINTSK